MTQDDVQWVWVAARRRGGKGEEDVYHTNRGCRHLRQATTVYSWPLSSIKDRRGECTDCDDDQEREQTEQNHDYYRAARDHSGADLSA